MAGSRASESRVLAVGGGVLPRDCTSTPTNRRAAYEVPRREWVEWAILENNGQISFVAAKSSS